MEKARATTSSKYDVTVNVDFSEMKDVMSGLNSMPSLGANSQKLSLTVKGLSDISDPENFKNSSVVSLLSSGLNKSKEYFDSLNLLSTSFLINQMLSITESINRK